MGQVTIYLDDAIEKKMRSCVKSMHISQSKWIAQLIHERIAGEWPASVAECAGAWKDFPALEEIRRAVGEDVQREEV